MKEVCRVRLLNGGTIGAVSGRENTFAQLIQMFGGHKDGTYVISERRDEPAKEGEEGKMVELKIEYVVTP